MTYRAILFLTIISNFSLAQQNEDFREVKNHFDRQRMLLTNEFKKRSEISTADEKIELKDQFVDFMIKLDSVQNSTYVRTLVKVKNDEDLKNINKWQTEQVQKQTGEIVKTPEYPGGMNNLRTQVAELFYFDSTTTQEQILKTNVTFLVEQDGYISNVVAEGQNQNFNRQAMIAIYLLPEKFKPATVHGTPVRYLYRLPLSMNVE